MRKTHVVLICIIAIACAMILSTTSSTGKYANFNEAFADEGEPFTIVGQLNKSKPIEYNPQVDPNMVTFFMTDKKGKEVKVYLNQSKPQDFERSEDVVVKGIAKGDAFYAKTVLLKCPSKYQEEQQFNQ
ncbi:cytochrome c maturation protein CcmE domain-containing protein [Sediminitomix flava]|uniref:Cytochrome c-type biogenesis protein CcmE n=1 Tax=Sediminitomix flava TaxID=379075 RepID=A0A315ZGN1_SEDFL|nr:cytochrome c maturation protein CcmE [Sediminitomix flava]PWJ44323.1 cytochrome c-type biogenesis protein CcmE [Sediminitomix flava]